MNVTELARKLHVTPQELREALPQIGFDIGKKAIKIDDRTAQRIIFEWPSHKRKLDDLKRASMEKEKELIRQSNLNRELKVPAFITVRDFAKLISLSVNQVILELMKNGILASLNEKIDFDTACIIGQELGITIVKDEAGKEEDMLIQHDIREMLKRSDQTATLVPRPPVVVVMGHVDHGKTTLLDTIRKTDVVSQEKGGITQHIGAYQVEKNGRYITFIDTPGHEAFTAMRSRGAKIADIAILVVAADDSLKPQTLEAIKIIEQSKLPMIVAINKVDKPEANIEKVKQDLAQKNLIPEEWSGKTICVEISAKFGKNIDALLDMILLLTDIEKEHILADPNAPALASVIESHLDKGEGPVATVIVHSGTLLVGDYIARGDTFYGKIRAMKDWHGDIVENAPPSFPVKIIGLKVVPSVGDVLEVRTEKKGLVSSEKLGKRLAQERGLVSTLQGQGTEEENEKMECLKLTLKTDVLGSAEAIVESLEKIEHTDVYIKILSRKLGNINEADILNAEVEGAYVIGFNVALPPPVAWLAKEKNVSVHLFSIIYDLLNFVKQELQKLLKEHMILQKIGVVGVLAKFRVERNSMIIGVKVKEGHVEAGTQAHVYRGGTLICEGEIKQVQVGRETVKDVIEGGECGIEFHGKPSIEIGDTLEIFHEELVKKQLE